MRPKRHDGLFTSESLRKIKWLIDHQKIIVRKLRRLLKNTFLNVIKQKHLLFNFDVFIISYLSYMNVHVEVLSCLGKT